jgi:PAS domain S-box-containing protein
MTPGGDGKRALAGSETLERVTDGVVAVDREFRYTYVNGPAAEILGRDGDELLGNCVWDVFPEVVGTPAETHLREAMATQRPIASERHNPELDRWFDVRFYPDDGGLSIYFTDVTEKKRIEHELERRNRQLSALVENTAEAVYAKDRDGVYQFVNEAAAALFGLDPDEVVGRRDEDLFDEESAAAIRAVDTRIVEEGAPDTREAVQYIDGERYVFLDHKYAYWDEHGDVAGVMGMSLNVTARKTREQELRELTEEYGAVFESAGDAVFLVDVDVDEGTEGAEAEFRFVRLNPSHETSTGFTTEDVRGKTPREVLGEELGLEVEANYRRCVEAREPITYDEVLPLPGGRRVWQTRLAPVVVDGEITRIVGIARDTTDRVGQERELRRKNERLDEFAGVVSHDLRNPLNVAQGRVELARTECDSDHLPIVGRALDRMEAIIEDTLTLARQGETVAGTEAIRLSDLLEECWETVDTAGATLDGTDGTVIRGDWGRLQHVFENLFRNAVEHGGSDVTVRVGGVGSHGLYVEDDGPGISDERRELIFEPGHSSVTGGTGFGLTIVRRIAEAHGWTVRVTDGDDGGARFEFAGVEHVS